jgi:hypothetical protein
VLGLPGARTRPGPRRARSLRPGADSSSGPSASVKTAGQATESRSMTNDLLRAALRYATRGWPVLPVWWPAVGGACACGRPDCSKPGKHPLSRRGFYDASTDPAVIARWWARWPEANVGIRTGGDPGLMVADVDGTQGQESLHTLRLQHGAFAAAWVRSGSGGWHAYMRRWDGLRVPNSTGRLGPGLDVRGDGGSIVAPPSRHASGGRYAWLAPGAEPPLAPGWLIQLALPPNPSSISPRVAGGGLVSDQYAKAAIQGEADAVAQAPPGTRNDRLNVAAWKLGRLVAGGVADEAIVRDVLTAAATAAGLSHGEIASTVRSGMSAGMRIARIPGSPGSPATAAAAAASRRSLRL